VRLEPIRLVVALVLGLFASSFPADAQQPRVARVGVLSEENPSLKTLWWMGVAQGLRDLGYIEGQNITFERRYAAGRLEILPTLADELVRLEPDLIFAVGTISALAAKRATQTIPIVFARTADPIGSGLVPALARPGGNLTGLSDQMVEIGAKRLEFIKMAVPEAKRVGILWNSDYPAGRSELKELEQAARSLNLQLIPVDVRSRDEFDPALRALVEQHSGAVIVTAGTNFTQHAQGLADMTAKAGLPTIFSGRRFVDVGGLMSYGVDTANTYRRAAALVDKILKGAKPADIPVEQPTKFELVINLKTAKALGLTIPHALLLRADEIIE
jgi:putative ABC transport system substrate-binding protein